MGQPCSVPLLSLPSSALHRVSVPLVALLLQQHQQWWPLPQLYLVAAVVVVEDAVVDAALAPLAHSHHVCAPLAHSQLPCAALVRHQLAEDVDVEDADAADGMQILCLDITCIQ